jgi:hypothetical protein
MRGSIVRITRERSISVRLPNDILIVFAEPADHRAGLDDVMSFSNLALDADVLVTNVTQGVSFTINLPAMDVHDLRLPMRHGYSRTPSPLRLMSE